MPDIERNTNDDIARRHADRSAGTITKSETPGNESDLTTVHQEDEKRQYQAKLGEYPCWFAHPAYLNTDTA